jgi:hypothetical protein
LQLERELHAPILGSILSQSKWGTLKQTENSRCKLQGSF